MSATAAPSRFPMGLRYMAIGAFFFSLMSVCVKLASRHLPSSHTVLARGVVTLVLSIGVLFARRPRRPLREMLGHDKPRLVLRGFAGFVALNCFYYAIKNMPLADATVIQYSSPVFTALFAAIFLGETMRRVEIVCMALSFAGVLLVAQPSFLFDHASSTPPLTFAIAIAGAIISAIAYTTIRRLRKTDHADVIVLYMPLVAMPLSIPAVARDATMPAPVEWLLLLGIGVTTQIAQMFMTKALVSEPAGRATAVSYLQVAFAYAWGLLIFGETPNALGILGALVVAVATIGIALFKQPVAPSA
jgi:drug/metabolite transporter (DMT)-like permease